MEGYDVCFKKSSAQHLPLGEIVLSGFIDFNLVTREGFITIKLMACENHACDIERFLDKIIR